MKQRHAREPGGLLQLGEGNQAFELPLESQLDLDPARILGVGLGIEVGVLRVPPIDLEVVVELAVELGISRSLYPK